MRKIRAFNPLTIPWRTARVNNHSPIIVTVTAVYKSIIESLIHDVSAVGGLTLVAAPCRIKCSVQ